MPIIDPHHHIWTAAHGKYDYMMPELLADVRAGHNIVKTVYCECRQSYRPDGPSELRPVGETEFVIDAVSRGREDRTGLCEGLVMHADLMLGAAVAAVLDAHVAVAGSRLKGIRQIVAHDPSPQVRSFVPRAGLLSEPAFREGVRTLARHGLVFETFVFHGQLAELAALADACPDAAIVVDALGGPLGVGPYKDRRDEVFPQWRRDIAALAERPNVLIHIGGFGAKMFGFGFHKADRPATEDFAAAWRPYLESCLAAFGAERCMLTSNFPEDGSSISYRQLWNVFKYLCRDFPAHEKARLFSETSKATYHL
ncbi:MAG: amidohydrolase family protein [Sphingobium sp.]